MPKINIKYTHRCAFCEYWWDPSKTHISTDNPNAGIWSYDNGVSSKCLKRNLTKLSDSCACSNFVSKV